MRMPKIYNRVGKNTFIKNMALIYVIIGIVILVLLGKSGLLTAIVEIAASAGWGCLTVIVVGFIILIAVSLANC